jgi:hypothetical protein
MHISTKTPKTLGKRQLNPNQTRTEYDADNYCGDIPFEQDAMLFNSLPFLFAFFLLKVIIFLILGCRSPLLAGLRKLLPNGGVHI